MVARSIVLALPLALAVLGLPQVRRNNDQVTLNMQAPDQTPQSSTGQGNNIIINIFENPEVEPMCRPNDAKCKYNYSCCSGYCSWYQGYKCKDRNSFVEEEAAWEEKDPNDL